MPRINTKDLVPAKLPATWRLWVYNALDATVTYEVRDALRPLLDNVTTPTYRFSLDLQAPVLDMMRRGMRVDTWERQRAIEDLDAKANKLQTRLDKMAWAVWDKGLNPRSSKQVQEFFYDRLGLPAQYKRDPKTKEKKKTVDRDALEILGNYFQAEIFVNHILAIRELSKLSGALKAKLDPDQRIRTTFNIAGTETGRFSSEESATDTGTNMQNQTERIRRVYVADRGYKLGVFDLKTGESFAVGLKCHLLGYGRRYLDACKSGDLHTGVSKLVWPQLAWGGPGSDKDVAKQVFYRHFSYRDMAKRGGHGTNYYGKPWTMAKHLKVDKRVMEDFQKAYFLAFPEIQDWHQWVAGELQSKAELVSLMGRRRIFFGRLRDDQTLKEAIAYDPQSSIADYTNQWLLRVYRNVPEAQLLLQGHDALVVQFPLEAEAEMVERIVAEAGHVRLAGDHPDSCIIPVEAKTGWNWANVDPKQEMFPDGNPFGLREYNGKDERVYEEPSVLDRRFS